MTVAVLGGGIQGCSVALELAERGFRVDLFDSAPSLLTAASRHNEGKIHLGYVYSADETLRTAALMARGAAVFGSSLRRWLGADFDSIAISTPFNYAVHRNSMRTPCELARTYREISSIVEAEFAGRSCYLGGVVASHVRRLTDSELDVYGPNITAGFETAEVAIDPDALADRLNGVVLAHPRIRVHTSARVDSVDADRRRMNVSLGGEPIESVGPFVHIVNCAWSGRPAIDATTGIHPVGNWSFRMKYFVRVNLADAAVDVPSTTVVIGSFGDIVDFGEGNFFLSWYPVGRRGWSTELSPPSWPTDLGEEDGQALALDLLAGFGLVVPGLAELASTHADRCVVRGGVIFALGDTDLADPTSRLHERHAIGPHSHGNYHTIDTGKLTVAPLFASIVADRIEAASRG